MAPKLKTTFVPCNGCTLCCQGDAIRLTEEDNPEDYLTEPHPYIAGALDGQLRLYPGARVEIKTSDSSKATNKKTP